MWQADIWKGLLSREPAVTSKPAAAAAVGDEGGWILSQSIAAICHVWDLQTGFYSRGFWGSPQSPAVGLATAAMGQRLGLLVVGWDSGWPVWQGRGFSCLGEAATAKIVSSVLTMTKPLLEVMSVEGRRWGKHLQGSGAMGTDPKGRSRLGCHTPHRFEGTLQKGYRMGDKKGFSTGCTEKSRNCGLP